MTLNLSTGNDADDLFTVEGAMFTTGSNGAMTNHEGAFTMQPAACIGALLQQMIVRYA